MTEDDRLPSLRSVPTVLVALRDRRGVDELPLHELEQLIDQGAIAGVFVRDEAGALIFLLENSRG